MLRSVLCVIRDCIRDCPASISSRWLFSAAWGVALAGWALPVEAQVVQLPGVRQFAYSGGVSVPDGGEVGLGGVVQGAAAAGQRGSGLGGSSSFGSSASTATASVSAMIIDLQAMDAALLGRVERGQLGGSSPYPAAPGEQKVVTTTRTRIFESSNPHLLATPPARLPFFTPTGGPGLIQPDYRGAAGAVHDEAEIRHFMERALLAQSAGRPASAQVYYRLAMERMTPGQQQRYWEQVQRNRAMGAAVEATEAGNGRSADNLPPATANNTPAPATPLVPEAADADNDDPFASPF
jgi:hypothetical protein